MNRIVGVLMLTLAIPMLVEGQQPAPAIPWGQKFFVKDNPPPMIVHDFGVVPQGTILTHRFEMENIYKVPIVIDGELKPTCGCVTVVGYSQKMDSREKGFIDIQMDSRKFGNNGIGAKQVQIPVHFKSAGPGPVFMSTATLQLVARTVGDVTVTPPQIQFGTVVQGQEAQHKLEIHYTGKNPTWALTAYDTNNLPIDLDVKAPVRQRGQVSYTVMVTLKKNAPPGMIQDHIFFKTNDSATPLLTVSFGAMIQTQLAAVQGDEQKLDPVPVGGTSVRKLQLRSAHAFRIVRIDGEANGLTVEYNKTPTPSPVQFVTLTFKPTQAGQLRQELTIYTDQKDKKVIKVEGIAYEP